MSSFNKFLSVALLLVVGIQAAVMVDLGRKLDTLTMAVRQMEDYRNTKTWPGESAESHHSASQTPATGEKYYLITDKQLRNLIHQSQNLQASYSASGNNADQSHSEDSAPEAENLDEQEEASNLAYQVSSEIENAIAYGRLDITELSTLAEQIGKLGPEERAEQLRQLTHAVNHKQIQIDLPQ